MNTKKVLRLSEDSQRIFRQRLLVIGSGLINNFFSSSLVVTFDLIYTHGRKMRCAAMVGYSKHQYL